MLKSFAIVRELGLAWTVRRITYEVRKRTGALRRRFPVIDASQARLTRLVDQSTPTDASEYRSCRERSGARFLFPAGRLPDRALLDRVTGPDERARTIAVADDYCSGRFLYYGRHVHSLGEPVDWLLDPFTNSHHEARMHWCDYPTFSRETGDVKDVWEPSRFACVYWLVRAYALTGDEKYSKAFWRLLETWAEQNPPNLGPNWKCGQETAIRLMAWCFALYAFWSSPATTADRVVNLAKLLAIHADRILGNINFAVSQKNNHGINEAVGLLTAGMLFPEMRSASRWCEIGRQVFETEVLRQVYADGSYVQHSMNYHRVMLHASLWAIRLAELNGQPFADEVIDRIGCAGRFLFEMLDVESGRTPNYGPSDGALILPLSGEDYLDYRPTVQAAMLRSTGRRVLPAGPWDETALWLYGESVLGDEHDPVRPRSSAFEDGGYYTLRTDDTWCMIRCHTYRDRPTHVDPLHVDLWHKGINLLADGGSYRYFDPDRPACERFFKDIQAHNTVTMAGHGPLRLASRFLWLPWPVAECLAHGDRRWIGEHYAYRGEPHGVVHRRSVTIERGNCWQIVDELLGNGPCQIELRWRLPPSVSTADEMSRRVHIAIPPGPVEMSIDGPKDLVMVMHEGTDGSSTFDGWASDYYGELHPTPTLAFGGRCALPVRLITTVRLVGREPE